MTEAALSLRGTFLVLVGALRVAGQHMVVATAKCESEWGSWRNRCLQYLVQENGLLSSS